MRLRRDPLYKVILLLVYLGVITLLIFSKLIQFLILISFGFFATLLFYKLVK